MVRFTACNVSAPFRCISYTWARGNERRAGFFFFTQPCLTFLLVSVSPPPPRPLWFLFCSSSEPSCEQFHSQNLYLKRRLLICTGPQMIPVPQMIPNLDRKWAQDRKWSLQMVSQKIENGVDSMSSLKMPVYFLSLRYLSEKDSAVKDGKNTTRRYKWFV